MIKTLLILATTALMLGGPTLLVAEDYNHGRETRRSLEEQQRAARKAQSERQRETRKAEEQRQREARKAHEQRQREARKAAEQRQRESHKAHRYSEREMPGHSARQHSTSPYQPRYLHRDPPPHGWR